MKTISRSAGRTAAAAYRSATDITDERTGEVHTYRHKKGVVESGVILPPDAPRWVVERPALWNAAEAAEKRKNSTVAREIVVALPAEIDGQGRARIVREFAEKRLDKETVILTGAAKLNAVYLADEINRRPEQEFTEPFRQAAAQSRTGAGRDAAKRIEEQAARPTSASATTRARPPYRKPSNWHGSSKSANSKENGTEATTSGTADNQKSPVADNHTDFTVEQNSGVGLNAQNIGSGTGGNLEYKKSK